MKKRMKIYIYILFVIVCMSTEILKVAGSANSIFSEVELEWLSSSKRATINAGYPSSITPLNYYYYSSIAKGVLMDISSEFYKYTNIGFSSLPVTIASQNEDLIHTGVIDVIVTGKKAEYDDFYYSSPIQNFEYSFFVNPNSEFKLVEQLSHQNIGIVNNDDKILDYLNMLNSEVEVGEYQNYIELYKALTQGEIMGVFVPRELLAYQNINANLTEIKISDFTLSSWHFASTDEVLISIIDKILNLISTDEFYVNHFLKHENALNSKLYDFDKSTHEWLFYEKPVMKVGIYEIPGFMTVDQNNENLNGLGGYIFNNLSEKFGIKFDFIYGTYEELLEAFENNEIDLLPVFQFDINGIKSVDKYERLGIHYDIYQGEISAYGNYSTPNIDEEVKNNTSLNLGNILSPFDVNRNIYQNLNVNLYPQKTLSSAIEALKSGNINYVILDPNNLNYFKNYEIYPKGKVGKYTYSFLVQDDEFYTKFFTAVSKRDFETYANLEKYSNLLSSEMYLHEMALLQQDIYVMQQQNLIYVGIGVIALVLIVTLIRMAVHSHRTEYLKYTDYLTGLLNRLGYEKELVKLVNKKKPFSMMILDIDYFKRINDTYGHRTGDFIIEHFAVVLKRECGSDSVICRLGGDEFVVCCSTISESEIVTILERIREGIWQYNDDEFQELFVTASIGVVCTSGLNADVEALYTQADQALYKSKENGRNQYTIVNESKSFKK